MLNFLATEGYEKHLREFPFTTFFFREKWVKAVKFGFLLHFYNFSCHWRLFLWLLPLFLKKLMVLCSSKTLGAYVDFLMSDLFSEHNCDCLSSWSGSFRFFLCPFYPEPLKQKEVEVELGQAQFWLSASLLANRAA